MKEFPVNLGSQWSATLYNALISVGLTFFLGRFLGPEKFGTYSYVLTLASLFAILQDGGFKTLLLREKTQPTPELLKVHGKIFPLALSHVLIVTGLGGLLVVLLPFSHWGALTAALACFGLQTVVNFVSAELRGAGDFPRDALWQVKVRTISAIGILLALLYLYPEPWCVFAGWAIGILLLLFRPPVALCIPRFCRTSLRSVGKACFAFIAIDAATTLYFRSDIILLEHLTGNSGEVGQYAAAYRFLEGVILLAAPLGLICFRQLRMLWGQRREFLVRVVQVSSFMFCLAGVCLVIALLWGQVIVGLTFGDSYPQTILLLPWLLGALFFALPNTILTQAAIAQNRERLYAVAAGAGALVNIGLNLLLIPHFGGLGAAWATIASEGVLGAGLIWAIRK